MIQKKEFYSLAEIGNLLGISRIAVYKKVKSGEIEAIRIGRSYAVPAKIIAQILGKELRTEEKKRIDKAVKKVIKEYGEMLKKLGQE